MSEARFAHRMPFGAHALSGGATRFRLWAPSSPRADLLIGPARHRMERSDDGWHERILSDGAVHAGAAYAFEVADSSGAALRVPDPASRSNPGGVHGPSALVDPCAYRWRHAQWCGRAWTEAVIYELHVGTFTPQGTFAALESKLPELAALGITALELMPIAAFTGTRNWGYDGVLLYAPAACYGAPEELKSLIDAAHGLGLMVLLDVVYNHFGPDGNYLHAYCPEFFNSSRHTPWGAAINLDGPHSRTVRDFFVHNALYWIEEYRFDGLRLDAVHAFHDRSEPDLVEEIATALHAGPGREREVHLVLEDHRNEAHYLARGSDQAPLLATAQWNEDLHHALHVWLTGERAGYYVDFAKDTLELLGRALAEGFAFQGEYSTYRARARGEPSAALPPAAFVSFLQNHDMVGNRACGERIGRIAPAALIETAYVCLLLSPQVPMLFMGEEFAASSPFLYFCDVDAGLARAIAAGRARERERFASFAARASAGSEAGQPSRPRGGHEELAAMPEPNEERAFLMSKLRWEEALEEPHRSRRLLIGRLIELRRLHLRHLQELTRAGTFGLDEGVLRIEWRGRAQGAWRLWINTSTLPRPLEAPRGAELVYRSGDPGGGTMPAALEPSGAILPAGGACVLRGA